MPIAVVIMFPSPVNNFFRYRVVSGQFTTFQFIIVLGILAHLSNIDFFSYVTAFQNATEYNIYKKWGSEGKGDGQFQRPHDLDFSPDEKILYAVDRDGNRIQAFDKNGTFLLLGVKLGHDEGQFHVPYGIDVDITGNVWVVDRANDRVQKFDSNGNLIILN